jgi:hypothetical protein
LSLGRVVLRAVPSGAAFVVLDSNPNMPYSSGMDKQIYTPAEAKQHLEELALFAENENHHTECGVLYEAMGLMDSVTERALVIVPTAFGGIEKFWVIP